MAQRTASDIYTTIDKVNVGDAVLLQSGTAFTVTALRLKQKGYQFTRYDAPMDVWEVEGVRHESAVTSVKRSADEYEVTQHFADTPFRTTITTNVAIVCWRGNE